MGTASPAILTFTGWNIVIQYYGIIAPIPEAIHGLSIFYSRMMQRTLQVSIAIAREAPPLDTYNLWVGGVTTQWYALDGAIPWELILIVGENMLESTRMGWIGTWTAHCMRAGIAVLVRKGERIKETQG